MRVYKHEGKGHYIGSCIIVIAENAKDARELISKELIDSGLPDEEIYLTSFNVNNTQIIHSYNGDY